MTSSEFLAGLFLCRGNRRARHFLKGFLIYRKPRLNSRALTYDRCIPDPIAKGRTDRCTYLLNGNITYDNAMLVFKRTHWLLLFCDLSHVCSSHACHSVRSLIPINRAELAMTGMEESSCRSAPVTGNRMPGMASPTAIASTLREKIRFCLIARMAWRERLNRWGSFVRSSDKSAISAVSMATSVPPNPIATPTFAVARAGPSFTPSPTKATLYP